MAKLPPEVRQLMLERQEMAEAIVAEDGPLDEYLRARGAVPATATVYLFGSTATGRSEKNGRYLREESDLDLMVYAERADGEQWRIDDGPNPAFRYRDVQVEVIGGRVQDAVDGQLLAEHGMEPVDYTATREVPLDAILLRKPRQ